VDETITLTCGCTITLTPAGVKVTPVCYVHTADPTALGLLCSQSPLVQAMTAQAAGAASGVAFTYSGNPLSSPADDLRFKLNDTNASKPMFSDGEIAALLFQANGDVLLAAIAAVDILIGRFSAACDETVGSVSIQFSQKTKGYQALAFVFRRQLARRAIPYAGGMSVSQKLRNRGNTDLVQPSFTVGMLESPVRTGDTDYIADDGTGSWYLSDERYSGA
jgi:hypothetical protein